VTPDWVGPPPNDRARVPSPRMVICIECGPIHFDPPHDPEA
jgi:hypothetical protein